MNAIIKYPGSKWGIAKNIIEFFPEHHSYVEPYFGSGAVLFNKTRSNIETINDLDDNVTNLFYWIKKDPERLSKEIYFTPYSRSVYENAFKNNPKDDFEKAVNFYIKLNMSHGHRTNEKVGWKNDVKGREKAYAAQDWCNIPEKIMLAANRLRGVQIENRPGLDIIKNFNHKNVLIYIDPPYVLNTRHGKQYRFEMYDNDQEELLETITKHKGSIILSGYDNSIYNKYLKDWQREELYNKEILWMNFNPSKQMTINEFIN